MASSPQPVITRLVALATLGTLVVSTVVCAVIATRLATHDPTLDARATSEMYPRKHATTSSRRELTPEDRRNMKALKPTAPAVVQTGATAPLRIEQHVSPAASRALTFGGAATTPTRYPTTPASAGVTSTASSAELTLPSFPSSEPPSTTPPSYATFPVLPPSEVIAQGVVGPGIAPAPVAPPIIAAAPPSANAPTATILPGAPVEVPSAPLPPSPWSRFVASYGAGHFTEQGTISLADVRSMALRNNKDIAVVGNLPNIAGATAGLEEAVFDPVFTINPVGGRYNRQLATQVQSLSTTTNVLKTGFLIPGSSLNQVYLEKLYRTGGKVQIGVGQNLQQFSPAGTFVLVNPAWQSSVNLIAEQPLLRGRGPDWNEAPLRIARANQAQSQHSFRATVNQVLRDAEIAYWDAYAAYQDFEVRRTAAAQALQTVERERGRLQLGEGSVPDVAQAEEQAEAFQIAQTEAENRLIAAQRTLRRIMGIAPDDPRPVVPATAASDAPIVAGWEEAAHQAMGRPELGAQQSIVQAAEIEVCRRRNGLLPDISVRAIYSITGLDNHWDEAWSTVGTAGFNDWTVGAMYKQPLGRRADNSLAQRAAATLSLESAKLRQLEHEILHQLDAACQNVAAAEKLLSMHRRRREAAAIQLEARRELYLENRAQLRDELDAEVRYASAVLDESIARVNYQRALTDWNFARGAISADDVVVAP